MILFGGCLWWRIDAMALGVRRVEVDHLEMVVESFENDFPRYPCGERGDGREDGFRHDGCDDFVMDCAMLKEDGEELRANCI
jgi:hypothetical protein